MNELAAKRFGTSQSVLRKEDVRFLTGAGRYIDDTVPEGALFAVFLRSPMAHARVRALDVSEAATAPGVVAVFTARDFAGKLDNTIDSAVVRNRDGSRGAKPRRPVLAEEVVRFAGEALAIVVAETREAGLDAAEMIVFDLDELPVHVATAVGGTAIHPEAPENLAFDWAHGDEAATARAFAEAAHTTRLELVDNRAKALPMEPRGCFAEWDGARLHVAFSGQGVWGLRDELARAMGLDKGAVRVTTPDVGGGFGMKASAYPEYLAVAFAARETGRPVRWISTRSEAMLSDCDGRDHVTVAEAAFDADLRLKALRIDCVADLGACNGPYVQFIQSELALKVMPGVYDVQTTFFRVRGVFTNTPPMDAYRGAGRPEAIYVLERLMDWSARQLGVDPVELRRRSFIPPDAFPYRSAAGELYDTGDFGRVLDRALVEADVAGFAARKAESAQAGRLRGLGLCYYIESILGAQNETTTIAFAEDGMVELHVGTQSNGQGHETAFAQILAERSGIPFDRVRFVQGDSDRIATGGGTGGSRSATMQGSSIRHAVDEVVARFRPLAEEELEVAGSDLVFEDGAYRIAGTDRSVDLMRLAAVARRTGKADLLTTTREFTVPGRSYPNGAHFAEVEVDPETGQLKVVKYTVVDDFGYLINPMLAEGQVHGGVAQGIGQAVTEEVAYSPEGQLLSGSFMDHAMPRADDVPFMAFHTELVPSTANPIGMKGCGEAGTVGALAAVTNAALDALWEAGVRHVAMPLTPSRVWGWLQAAAPEGR
ncbi:xanthine dehydrogenase family protein molybdopterin-binding subunit [Amaricoccus sp.]|uniref:xanthine dehydrogenase family protein molybdopterin-binding subunit n=1 Tax=Amaricoccus sp. TaxID=1872485 RepID=UPI0026256DCF|nr:xanthine dehydrogenase family protein molybdopterin-binding subunit [Amaricoccus sp.]HRO11911.1 xanthine dehydrogenase family protein molybdopterin-binding subunit [Amaricoccus sp.]